jgi:REP element-mobilizing transposase RayT
VSYPPRIELPGGVHHITSRAVGHEPFFVDDVDRARLYRLLGRVVPRAGWVVHGYVFMTTHIHLVVRTPRPTLSRGMQLLLGPYALAFNERHRRRGHLVERRFKSKPIEDELHLYETLAYIDLNPVAAGMCKAADAHRWSGFRALAGLATPPSFLAADETLGLLGRDRTAASSAYRRLVESRTGRALARARLSRSSPRRA